MHGHGQGHRQTDKRAHWKWWPHTQTHTRTRTYIHSIVQMQGDTSLPKVLTRNSAPAQRGKRARALLPFYRLGRSLSRRRVRSVARALWVPATCGTTLTRTRPPADAVLGQRWDNGPTVCGRASPSGARRDSSELAKEALGQEKTEWCVRVYLSVCATVSLTLSVSACLFVCPFGCYSPMTAFGPIVFRCVYVLCLSACVGFQTLLCDGYE